MNYSKMLKTIIKSTGWSQEQLAYNLGVSFPTVNFWINGKTQPRKRMQERIKQLYLARTDSSNAPVYVTLQDVYDKVKVDDEVLLTKTPEWDPDHLAIYAINKTDFLSDEENTWEKYPDESLAMPIANAKEEIVKGTLSADRVYDRFSTIAHARIMFIFKNHAIALVENWGPDA